VPRPALSLGTGGAIYYSRTAKGYRARCYYCDQDGVRREVERAGRSKVAAANALHEALAQRLRAAGGYGELTGFSTVRRLGAVWSEALGRRDLSPNTTYAYRLCLEKHVYPALGEIRIRELTVSLVDRFLATLADRRGYGAAKMTRSVISGMCALAARVDALSRNLVRDTGPIRRTTPNRTVRAMTVPQLRQLRAMLSYDETARRRDILDLIDIMMASGARIGEACGIVWDAVDLTDGTVEIRSTVIRVTGEGLVNRPRPKSTAGHRRLALPAWAVAMLRGRHRGQRLDDLVFPAVGGGLRDPRNTNADIRDAVDVAGFSGWTSHLFGRKSVATILDEQGHSPRQIADVLGHANPSMTLSAYIGRKVADPGAADALAVLAFD
jgi:integrase